LFDSYVRSHPAQYRMPPMGQLMPDDELFQFSSRAGHRRETLAERHHGQTVGSQLRTKLSRIPPIEGDLLDVVHLSVFPDPLANDVIIDDIPLSRFDQSLSYPHVIRDSIFF